MTLSKKIKKVIDTKTKPIGSLGLLEETAYKICLIQRTIKPKLVNPTIIVFAGDHGIVAEGVSTYPQEVTRQMVLNFVQGGAAINVFCDQHDIALIIVDTGIKEALPKDLYSQKVINKRVGSSTNNYLEDPAMSKWQVESALNNGKQLVSILIKNKSTNIIGFGEMGIGNTSSAALISHLITDIPLESLIGAGAGLDDAGKRRKLKILSEALTNHYYDKHSPKSILATFGGFEIATMVGAFLEASTKKITILVDGFIATSAYLIAYRLDPNVKKFVIFTHLSDEKGHNHVLKYLQVKPLLNLNLRLGEGTGVALAFPLVNSAVKFMNEMASFETAKVSSKI